jgi:hypothetical protein
MAGFDQRCISMTFKRYDTSEVLVGAGDVFREDDGRQVGHARYRVIVQTAVLEDNTIGNVGSEAPGLSHISGNVVFAGAGQAGRLDLVGEALAPHLEDGRKLHFVLTNDHGDVSGRRLQVTERRR